MRSRNLFLISYQFVLNWTRVVFDHVLSHTMNILCDIWHVHVVYIERSRYQYFIYNRKKKLMITFKKQNRIVYLNWIWRDSLNKKLCFRISYYRLLPSVIYFPRDLYVVWIRMKILITSNITIWIAPSYLLLRYTLFLCALINYLFPWKTAARGSFTFGKQRAHKMLFFPPGSIMFPYYILRQFPRFFNFCVILFAYIHVDLHFEKFEN